MRSTGKTVGTAIAFAAIWLVAPPETRAQSVPDVTTFCSSEGGFNQRFGSTEIEGGVVMSSWAIVPLDQRFAPFDSSEVLVTQWGRRVHSVNATASYDDPVAARVAAEAMSAQFAARGWIERPRSDSAASLLDPAPEEGEHQYFSEAGGRDPESPTGIRAGVSVMGSSVTLQCVNLPLFAQARDEALGPPPVTAERPVVPSAPTFAAVNAAECDDPVRRDSLAERPGQILEPVLNYAGALGRHTQLLMAWHGDRLVRAGQWTEANQMQFALDLLGQPEVARSMTDALSLTSELMDLITSAADGPADSAADCRTAVALHDIVRRLLTVGEAQWRAIDAAYAAETARLGVTLEQ